MQLYLPQTQLIRKSHIDRSNEYWVHAVTFCNKIYYRAAGHRIHNDKLAENGTLKLELFLARDEDLPDVELLTPVVHTVYLGELPIDEEEGMLEIQTIAQVRDQDIPTGRAMVSPSSAKEEKERPWLEL